MTPASFTSVTPAEHVELLRVRLGGLPKYAMLLTLLVGVAAIADIMTGLFRGFPSWLGTVAVGTGLMGALVYVVHDQEAPHRQAGLPRYSTAAAVTGGGLLYFALGALASLPYVELAAAVAWLVFLTGYLVTMTAESSRGADLTAKRATWATGLLGLGLTGMFWLAGSGEASVVALLTTVLAAFPQLVHLSEVGT